MSNPLVEKAYLNELNQFRDLMRRVKETGLRINNLADQLGEPRVFGATERDQFMALHTTAYAALYDYLDKFPLPDLAPDHTIGFDDILADIKAVREGQATT